MSEKSNGHGGFRWTRYAFAQMQVGDVRRIPVDEQTCTWRSFQVYVGAQGRKHGLQLKCRQLECGAFECVREA